MAALLALPGVAGAQQAARFSGTVVMARGADTAGVPRTVVQLHRVSAAAQGVIDSTVTDRRGAFAFRVAAESGAAYLVSARHQGIEFFTPPLTTDRARPDTGIRIVVADTSSGPGARLRVSTRHLLVQGGDSAGWRAAIDLITISNPGPYTRVGPDTASPSYVTLLPPAASQPELADGDVGPEAVRFHDGALALYSPVAPGELQLTLQYLLPAGRDVAIPFGDTTAAFNLLLDGEGSVTAGPPLEGPIPTTLEGRDLRRWSGPVPGGAVVQLDLRGPRHTPGWLLAALVGLMTAGLLSTVFLLRRRRPALAKGSSKP